MLWFASSASGSSCLMRSVFTEFELAGFSWLNCQYSLDIPPILSLTGALLDCSFDTDVDQNMILPSPSVSEGL